MTEKSKLTTLFEAHSIYRRELLEIRQLLDADLSGVLDESAAKALATNGEQEVDASQFVQLGDPGQP